MSVSPWGVPAPPPTTESKFFNAARRTVTLLVEAGVDLSFWRTYRHDGCHLRHMSEGGREAALRELDKGKTASDAVLLALLDADLDRVRDRLVMRDDVVWTDGHDLETTLLGLPVLEKLVSQLVDDEKLESQNARWNESVRARLFRHAEGMGRLRWLKIERHPDLEDLLFKKYRKRGVEAFDEYKRAADTNWTPSLAKAIDAVIAFSNAQKLKGRDLSGECAALGPARQEQLCNGHDLVGFLHAWLADVAKGSVKDVEALTQLIAAGVERVWLETTKMWQALRAWEDAHPGFHVLRASSAA